MNYISKLLFPNSTKKILNTEEKPKYKTIKRFDNGRLAKDVDDTKKIIVHYINFDHMCQIIEHLELDPKYKSDIKTILKNSDCQDAIGITVCKVNFMNNKCENVVTLEYDKTFGPSKHTLTYIIGPNEGPL